jgi:methylthioribose-1-phosphate isomerase
VGFGGAGFTFAGSSHNLLQRHSGISQGGAVTLCGVDLSGGALAEVVAIRWADGVLELLDQRLLPREVSWVACRSSADVAGAIREMVVRGAPAIGISAAYGLVIAAAAGEPLAEAAARLLASRPTAVNLRWAVERMLALPVEGWEAEALRIHQQDAAINRAMGDVGAALLPANPVVYHHCNTGALATGGWGTALGVIRSVHAQGRRIHVWVGETRPWLQGARLTAWECQQEGIACTLLTEGAAASILGRCDAVLVGADRVAANGDTANKVGTHMLAVLARHFGVPFYVCTPLSTIDPSTPDGAAIPVEQRAADEVRGYRSEVWAADVPVFNPSFDITPASLITGWVTEVGLLRPPFVAPG